MVGRGSSGGGGEEGFTGRAAIGYDHGYDGEVFYLGLWVFHPPPYHEEVIPYPQCPGLHSVVAMVDEESVE